MITKIALAAVLVLIATVIVLSTLLVLADDEPGLELDQAIQIDFAGRYGQEAELLQIAEPQDMRLIYWQTQEAYYATLWIDGVWLEVASALREGKVDQP